MEEEEEDEVGSLQPEENVDSKLSCIVYGGKGDKDGLIEQVKDWIAESHVSEAETKVGGILGEAIWDS